MGLKPRDPWKTYGNMLAPYADKYDREVGDLGPTPLRFTNPRRPRSADDLTAFERDLVVEAGRGHDGKTLPIEVRMSTDPADYELSFAHDLEIWDIERDGVLAYHALICRGDSGSVHPAGAVETVGHIIQTYVDHCEPASLRPELKAALQQARRDYSGYMLLNMK